MIPRLEKMFQGWPALTTSVPAVPKPMHTLQPGVYLVNKSDVNQGRVSMGHLGTMRDNPDYYALNVMDDILGGGGFTSRIMSRVRSDEGLAYSAGSDYGFGVYYDGIFQASFQSKSPTVAQAAGRSPRSLKSPDRGARLVAWVEEVAGRDLFYPGKRTPRFFPSAQGSVKVP